MKDIIDEVTEDAKEEKHNYITKKIIKFFVITAAIVIVATCIYVWKERAEKELQSNLSIWFNH